MEHTKEKSKMEKKKETEHTTDIKVTSTSEVENMTE
jgi:hypothetical protein